MEQHNHHCRLTFYGFNWRITRCARNRIWVTRVDPSVGWFIESFIDTTDVDWETYAEAAVAWDRRAELIERWGGRPIDNFLSYTSDGL